MAPPPGFEPGSQEVCFKHQSLGLTVLNANRTTLQGHPVRSALDFLLKLSDWFMFYNLIEGYFLGGTDYRVDLLLQKAYRNVAHTAKPSLDVMPFHCFIAILLWLQNSPSFAQAALLPIHAWS